MTGRSAWIDCLRAVLLLLVVVHHCVYSALAAGAPVPELLQDAMGALRPFRMPVLLMLSGLFLPRALAKPTGRYVAGKLSALVFPYVLWFGLFYFVLLGDTHRPTDRWFVEIVVPQTPLWFLLYLIGFFALALPLRTPALRLAALAAGVAWLALDGHDTAWSFVFHLCCFLTGSLLADPPAAVREALARMREPDLSPDVRARARVVGYAAAACLVAATARHALAEGTGHGATWLVPALAALVVGRGLARLLVRTRLGQALAVLGPYTLVMLIAHTALLAAFPVASRTLTLGATDSVWLTIAAATGVTIGAVVLVRHWEPAWLAFDLRRGLAAVSAGTDARPDPDPQADRVEVR